MNITLVIFILYRDQLPTIGKFNIFINDRLIFKMFCLIYMYTV